MPLTGLAVTLSGLKEYVKGLVKTRLRVRDLRPIWPTIIDDFADRHAQAFRSGGHPGHPWKPLNEKYAARKAAAGFGTRILVRTGRLEASLTQPSNSEFISKKRRMTLSLGTSVRYAPPHQDGWPGEPEPRPPLLEPPSNAQRLFIRKTIDAFIRRNEK